MAVARCLARGGVHQPINPPAVEPRPVRRIHLFARPYHLVRTRAAAPPTAPTADGVRVQRFGRASAVRRRRDHGQERRPHDPGLHPADSAREVTDQANRAARLRDREPAGIQPFLRAARCRLLPHGGAVECRAGAGTRKAGRRDPGTSLPFATRRQGHGSHPRSGCPCPRQRCEPAPDRAPGSEEQRGSRGDRARRFRHRSGLFGCTDGVVCDRGRDHRRARDRRRLRVAGTESDLFGRRDAARGAMPSG